MSERHEIVALGDRALRFSLPRGGDRRALLERLRAGPGIVDVILAEEVGAVVLADNTTQASATDTIERLLALPVPVPVPVPDLAPAHHIIRVAYDGPDLEALATALALTPAEVIALHAGRDYEVAMIGFLPGFAYLRGIDPRLVVARRERPRTRVPAGSVAIAAGYTGIYPFASPGGWHLLGETIGHRPFDANGARLAVGDRVRFEEATRSPPRVGAPPSSGPAAVAPAGRYLEVRKAMGLALVVDRGRVGHMHEGVPHGGPMVAEAFAFANTSLGNGVDAAGIEIYGVLEVIARGGRIAVADDVNGPRVIEDGEVVAVATEGRARVRYLAVGGGVDVPVVLGGRGTLVVAGIGGFEGRALRRGDCVAVIGGESECEREIGHGHGHGHGHGERDGIVEVVVSAGPECEARVMEAIEAATFSIGVASDRTGTRLEGSALPSMHSARDWRSMPMVLGAIELTPSGLVVLGPDHPTTGGYPVVAIVQSAAIGRFLSLRIGARVRLRREDEAST